MFFFLSLGVAPIQSNSHSSQSSSSQTPAASKYCSKGCAKSWLGDNVCDKKCDNIECGFDAIDCGVQLLWDELRGFSTKVDTPTTTTVVNRQGAMYNVTLTSAVASRAQDNGTGYVPEPQQPQQAGNESIMSANSTIIEITPVNNTDLPYIRATQQRPVTVGPITTQAQTMGTSQFLTDGTEFVVSHLESAVYLNLSAHFPPGNSTILESFHWNTVRQTHTHQKNGPILLFNLYVQLSSRLTKTCAPAASRTTSSAPYCRSITRYTKLQQTTFCWTAVLTISCSSHPCVWMCISGAHYRV